jgi:hypothetical protein
MSRQTERRKQAEKAERQRRKAKREARKAARVPLSAAEGNRRWLSGRFLTSWFWIKKIASVVAVAILKFIKSRVAVCSERTPGQ